MFLSFLQYDFLVSWSLHRNWKEGRASRRNAFIEKVGFALLCKHNEEEKKEDEIERGGFFCSDEDSVSAALVDRAAR